MFKFLSDLFSGQSGVIISSCFSLLALIISVWVKNRSDKKLEKVKLENNKNLTDIKHLHEIEIAKLKAEIDKANSFDRYKFESNYNKRVKLAEDLIKSYDGFYYSIIDYSSSNFTDKLALNKMLDYRNEMGQNFSLTYLYFEKNITDEISNLHIFISRLQYKLSNFYNEDKIDAINFLDKEIIHNKDIDIQPIISLLKTVINESFSEDITSESK